jgi:hypothetical protein
MLNCDMFSKILPNYILMKSNKPFMKPECSLLYSYNLICLSLSPHLGSTAQLRPWLPPQSSSTKND